MYPQKGPAFGKLTLIFAVVFVCAVGLGIYLYRTRPPAFDATLQKTFSNVSHVTSYAEYVQTKDALSGRTLEVDGTYLLDAPDDRFSSFSTTTLTAEGGGKPVVFALDNISIGQDLYTKVEAEGDATLAVPSSSAWRHFQANDIPGEFVGIAIPGPLLDNLQLFGEGGKYLTLTGGPEQEQLGGTTLTRYTFKLSAAADGDTSGTLGALIARIGDDGAIDVWIDASEGEVRYMRFTNASYTSTTTISDINGPLTIEPPAAGG